MQLIIYDKDKARLSQCVEAVKIGARRFGVSPEVTPVDDPLEMARQGLNCMLPAIDLGGMIWSLNNGQAFTSDQIEDLLARFI